jgi:5-methylcytosine-specific restriction protein A
MPSRICLEPRCPDLATYRGRCAGHARERERHTHTNKAFYNSKRWRMLRKLVLFEQPLCACGEIATDVDHIVAIEDGGDRWAQSNVHGLCRSCHSRKTNREVRAR